jgi:O-antigen/teichoic acid export membrane protein
MRRSSNSDSGVVGLPALLGAAVEGACSAAAAGFDRVAVFALLAALVLRYFDGWTSWSVVLLMGSSALVAVLAGSSANRPRVHGPLLGSELCGVLREHWQFGRWLSASSVCYWVGAAGYLPIVGGIIGLEAAGAMRAVQALFQPLDQVIASLGLLLVPAVARRGRLGGLPTIRLWSQRISAAYASAAALYGVVLTAAATWVLHLLYGGAYDRYGWMIPVMVLGSVASSAGHGLVIGLNAAERTDAIFKSRAIGAASSLMVGLPMAAAWKLPGAVSAVALSALVICASLACFHWQAMRVGSTRIS